MIKKTTVIEEFIVPKSEEDAQEMLKADGAEKIQEQAKELETKDGDGDEFYDDLDKSMDEFLESLAGHNNEKTEKGKAEREEMRALG